MLLLSNNIDKHRTRIKLALGRVLALLFLFCGACRVEMAARTKPLKEKVRSPTPEEGG